MNGQHLWLSSLELCVYGKNKNSTFNEHCASPVWRLPPEPKEFHPTAKPIKLMEIQINASTNENDIVLDPFMGSGTTAKVSVINDRNWIGSEISEEYCNILNTRLKLLST
jgi:DNA modification methylase